MTERKTIGYEYVEHLVERQAKNEELMLDEFRDGEYTLENPLIKYNPYIINDLSAVILFRTEEKTPITLRVKGKTPEADFYQNFPAATEHVLPIVGLYSDYENKIELYPYQKPNRKVTHTIKTPKSKHAHLVKSIETTPEYMQDQVMMLCPASNDLAIAVDYAGDVRLDFNDPILWDLKLTEKGHFSMGTGRVVRMPYFVTGIYEFSPVGKIYKEYRVPNGYHHDQAYMPNGDILALSGDWQNGTVEDQCVLIDKDTGHVKKRWNFKDFLEPGAQKSGSWDDEDWFHCNAVWYDENTNSLTFSGRHINACVNIDFDTSELNWIISDPEGWPEEYQKYLFTPVGDGEFDWQYEQHSNLITPLGDVMCFDNHHWGSQNPDNYKDAKDSFSRSVKWRIDTEKMEIEQLWQYGKERGADFFSPYICNTKYYNEGHYLTHSGGIAFDAEGNPSDLLGAFVKAEDPNSSILSTTVETINDEVVFELHVNSNYYRANKVTLYNKEYPENDLILGRGVVLGQLGETMQMDVDVPAEETGELMAEWYDARLVDEKDNMNFYAKFERGQMVQLIFDNGEGDVRKYFVSTAKGMRGAMCAGTFLPDDDRETRTAITKRGWEGGDYSFKVLVDDKIYETGLTIQA